jgi:para-nitrobenzyl esterase
MTIRSTNYNNHCFDNSSTSEISTSVCHVKKYLNIPYVKSTKEKRWAIQSVATDKNIASSSETEYGKIAPQIVNDHDFLMTDTLKDNQDESCLNLNIYKCCDQNSSKVDQATLPVMVWIHGGGFSTGSGSLPIYDGSKLAIATNTVVVTLNYRLGALGFLRLSDVTQGEINTSGNEGLDDQVTALKWVQENIHRYGGDKNNVTLFGESAGAMSIACLLAMPTAKGFFHKAILQSGAGHTFSSKEQANDVANEFINSAKALGFCVSDLMSISTDEMLSIQKHFLARPEIYKKFGILPFKPVVDGNSLPLAPYEAIKQGCAVNIPIISGTNTDEWTLFAAMLNQNITDEQSMHKALVPLIGSKSIESAKHLMNKQCQARNLACSYQNLLSELLTEFWFTQPSQRLIEAQQAAGGKVYCYKLGRKTVSPTLRCTHITDIGLIFNNIQDTFHGTEPRVNKLSAELQQCWGHFAYHGKPKLNKFSWPLYDSSSSYVYFDHDKTHIDTIDTDSIEFWSSVTDQQLASF